jgi:hypothetical protein
MPAQQRRRRHHEPVPASVREQSRKRRDERAAGGAKPRSPLLTSQNRELVPQQHQFHVLGELGPTAADERPQNSCKGKQAKERSIERSSQAGELVRGLILPCAVQRFLVSARA